MQHIKLNKCCHEVWNKAVSRTCALPSNCILSDPEVSELTLITAPTSCMGSVSRIPVTVKRPDTWSSLDKMVSNSGSTEQSNLSMSGRALQNKSVLDRGVTSSSKQTDSLSTGNVLVYISICCNLRSGNKSFKILPSTCLKRNDAHQWHEFSMGLTLELSFSYKF